MFALAAMKICDEGRRDWPAGSVTVELQSTHHQVWGLYLENVCFNLCVQNSEDSFTSATHSGAFQGIGTPAVARDGNWKVLRCVCVLGNSLEAKFWQSELVAKSVSFHHADIRLKIPEAFVKNSEIFKQKLIYMQTTLLIF